MRGYVAMMMAAGIVIGVSGCSRSEFAGSQGGVMQGGDAQPAETNARSAPPASSVGGTDTVPSAVEPVDPYPVDGALPPVEPGASLTSPTDPFVGPTLPPTAAPTATPVPSLDTAEGSIQCQKVGVEFQIDDWQPYVNAPAGFLYGKSNIMDLKNYKTTGEGNVVLKSAYNLAVGAKFPDQRLYAVSRYEFYNDTGARNHFGKEWAVEVSLDGTTWTKVESKVTGVLGKQSYNFAKPVTSKMVRIRLTGLPEGPGWDVWWFKVFGTRLECAP